MKNQNKANAGRTQIADISVAGKELTEEHLRTAAGGVLRSGPRTPVPTTGATCTWVWKCTSLGCTAEKVCIYDGVLV